MQFLDYNENKQRGTYEFPFEFHHVDQYHPQYIMSYHWHMEFELIRILKGEFKITINEEEIKAYEGDFLFISGSTLHAGIPYACVYECIVFDLNAFSKYNTQVQKMIQDIIDQKISIFHHFSKSQKELHQVVWTVFDAMKKKHFGYELTVFGQLYHFFGLVYEKKLYTKDLKQTRRDHKRIMHLKEVLELIETSYDKPLTLEALSATSHMSPKYFCRFFYEMTHKTPIDYLNHHRIEHACYQLITTENSVTDIAYSCGFNDLSYFIKTFKKYKGVTPGKYKQA